MKIVKTPTKPPSREELRNALTWIEKHKKTSLRHKLLLTIIAIAAFCDILTLGPVIFGLSVIKIIAFLVCIFALLS